MSNDDNATAEKRRLHFLGWQCRLRQHSIRESEGRPSAGMRPEVFVSGNSLGAITVLMLKAASENYTAQFRYMVKKTPDPAERYDAAIKLLAAAYYQRRQEFSDHLTALFGPGSALATHLAGNAQCELYFEQFNQSYRLPCAVEALEQSHPYYQGTYWHNSLFNHAIPGDAMVLSFKPDWENAAAEPEAV